MAEYRDFEEELENLLCEWRASGEQISPEEEQELETLISEARISMRASREKLQNTQKRFQNIFFQNVGQAISVWGTMENTLVAIVGVLLGTRFDKAGLMLYSNQNFHVWLNIIDELLVIDARYTDLRKQWTDISDRLRALNDTRVRLAHHTFFHGQRDPNSPSLKPSRFDSRSKSRKYQPLEIEQIIAFVEAMTEIHDSLSSLVRALAARLRASRGKLVTPQTDPLATNAQ